MTSRAKAYIAALVYVMIIGLSFMFVKIALQSAEPLDILADRFSIAFLAGSFILIIKKIKLHIKFKDLLAILPLAMFYPVLFFSFQAFGLAYATSAEAGIIQACIPILTLLLAMAFLKENSSARENIFTLLSVSGVIYIFVMSGSSAQYTDIVGMVLIFFSSLAAACYNVMAKNLTRKYSAIMLTYFMTVLGMLVFNCAALSQHIMNNTVRDYFLPFTDGSFLWSVLYLGILSSLGSAFLSNYALGKIEAAKMSVFTNLGTLITIAAGVLFLQEQLHYFQLIGAVPIILGVIGTNYFAAKRELKK
ncbi:DMT family transporter [Pectinatus cerevisiiphilus]|uniref:Drug/metabolite transporter (DMT)-like permease n=1 Tax=Pectinatus cerevisiiphilus TaxID=86956 RepID=A0A4R3K1V4_9FIRM|nr:DMT family transporter [Pectinatus cerevisiiphilus]TCS75951.1 drug/metabolite transporter (DMT)-like permease [Pectinatus cerevisiiphilus]